MGLFDAMNQLEHFKGPETGKCPLTRWEYVGFASLGQDVAASHGRGQVAFFRSLESTCWEIRLRALVMAAFEIWVAMHSKLIWISSQPHISRDGLSQNEESQAWACSQGTTSHHRGFQTTQKTQRHRHKVSRTESECGNYAQMHEHSRRLHIAASKLAKD